MTRESDPEALRSASAAWREMGRQLDDMLRGLDRGVGQARTTHWRGPSAEAFDADWRRLRSTVEEALPVFELAAAELADGAADTGTDTGTRTRLHSVGDSADDSAPAGSGDRPQQASEGGRPAAHQAMYAMMALTQIGAALGSTFGSRGAGAGGKGSGRQLARSEPQQRSGLPRSADPFEARNPAVAAAAARPGGGLGIAGGVRGPARGAAAAQPPGASGTGPGDGDGREGQPRAGAGPGPAGATARTTGRNGDGARDANDAETNGGGRVPGPDPRRHGAFG